VDPCQADGPQARDFLMHALRSAQLAGEGSLKKPTGFQDVLVAPR